MQEQKNTKKQFNIGEERTRTDFHSYKCDSLTGKSSPCWKYATGTICKWHEKFSLVNLYGLSANTEKLPSESPFPSILIVAPVTPCQVNQKETNNAIEWKYSGISPLGPELIEYTPLKMYIIFKNININVLFIRVFVWLGPVLMKKFYCKWKTN